MDTTYTRAPPSLKDLGLDVIADVSANGLLNFIRKSRRDGQVKCLGNVLEKVKDRSLHADMTEKESDLHAIRDYIEDLPKTLFDEYAEAFMENKTTRKIMDVCIGTCHKCINLVLDQIVSDKLTSFASFPMNRYFHRNANANVLLEKISECKNIDTLSVSSYPNTDEKYISFSRVLQNLNNLTYLYLSPVEGRSFHWAFKAICLYCPHIVDLWVMYDGSLCDGEEGIDLLKECKNLQTLWLLDFSDRYEPSNAVSRVCVLLKELKKLRTFYHRSMLKAIQELHDTSFVTDNSTTLNLQSLYSFDDGIDTILCAVKMCPNIEMLNLKNVTQSLEEVMTSLSKLRLLSLHGSYVKHCLPHYFHYSSFPCLTVLKLESFRDVDYDFLSACAQTCPSLQVLSLRHCRIDAIGKLNKPGDRIAAFPCLRKLILTPLSCNSTSFYFDISSKWEVGTALVRYLLSGANKLKHLHIHLRHHPTIPRYEWFSQDFLDEVLFDEVHPKLLSLQLINPSDISLPFVERLINSHTGLHTIAGVRTWPLSAEDINELRNTHRNIDVTDNCVCSNPLEWGGYFDHDDGRGNNYIYISINYCYITFIIFINVFINV
nr:MAG: hypothetical protein [Penaeus semisulcatus pemonivirus]